MYGATKILFYQTKYFQGHKFFKFYKLLFRLIFKNKFIFYFFYIIDYLFEVNWKLHEINR